MRPGFRPLSWCVPPESDVLPDRVLATSTEVLVACTSVIEHMFSDVHTSPEN